MTTTNDNDVSTTTDATTAKPAKAKLTAVKDVPAAPTATPTDATPTAASPDVPAKPGPTKKPASEQASYLAVALAPELRARLDATAQTEGVSSAAVVRRAVLAQFAAGDNADAAKSGKVDVVSAKLDDVLAKLTRLDLALDSALSDTVRVADRLKKATTPQG